MVYDLKGPFYNVEISYDNGATWSEITTTGTTGNDAFNRLIWRIRAGAKPSETIDRSVPGALFRLVEAK